VQKGAPVALKIHGIVGYLSESTVGDRIHSLQHEARVENLLIQPQDVARHRLRAVTDKGTECQIIIPRDQRLGDGAVLMLEKDRAIVVRIDEQRWLKLAPLNVSDGLELGYFCGNLHWRVRFEPDCVLIALEGPEEDYLSRLALFLETGRARRVANE